MSINITSLKKNFGDQVLFDGINLVIPENRTTLLSGPSGCGKTTLLRIIAGLDSDYDGTVTGVPDSISFIFQEDRLLPWKSVNENISYVLKDIINKEEIDSAVRDMIEAVQLTGHENKIPAKLSGGMKRRVAMARAYCYPADIYIFDEPFKGFDAKLLEDMIALFKRLFIDTGKTVILVNHDVALLENLDFNIVDIG